MLKFCYQQRSRHGVQRHSTMMNTIRASAAASSPAAKQRESHPNMTTTTTSKWMNCRQWTKVQWNSVRHHMTTTSDLTRPYWRDCVNRQHRPSTPVWVLTYQLWTRMPTTQNLTVRIRTMSEVLIWQASCHTAGSAAHDDGAVQSRPCDYQGLDPSVLETLRQPPAPSVYASLIPTVPVMSQDVSNAEADGANPHNTEGLDLTSLLPRKDAVIRSTSQTAGSAAHDDGAVQSRPGDYQGLDPSVLKTLRQPPTPSVYASLSGNRADVSQEVDNTGPDAANNEALNAARLNELSLPDEHDDMSSTS